MEIKLMKNTENTITYNFQPIYHVELLNDMKEIEDKKYPSDPKATHGNKIEPIGSADIV